VNTNQQMIIDKTREIISEVGRISPERIVPDAAFATDLDLDSISMVEIAVCAQKAFGIEVPDDDVATLKRVHELETYLLGRLGADITVRQE
jgi:acyl carrier protein